MNQVKRPVSISVIGWLVAIVGGWGLLSSLASLAGIVMGGLPPPLPREMAERLPIVNLIFNHYFKFALFNSFVSFLLMLSGIYLLKLRAWARNLLEVICWIMIFGSILFGFQFIVRLDALMAVGIVCVLVYIMPFAILIYFLRTPKIRNTVSAT